jgi:superfamily I DNA/RNA helicase
MPPFNRTSSTNRRFTPNSYAAPRVQAQAPTPKSSVQPSVYQKAIMEWLVTGTGNAIVDAKAGSGKTSTLCMLSDLIPTVGSRAAFLAFNRSIADELKRRLPAHVQAATFHSVCNAALRRHPACGAKQ